MNGGRSALWGVGRRAGRVSCAGVVAVAGLVACAGPGNAPAPPVAAQPPNHGEPRVPSVLLEPVDRLVLAEVEGAPVFADEVFPTLYLSNRDAVLDAVQQAVMERVVGIESAKLGIVVDAAPVEERVTAALKDLRERVAKSTGDRTDLEQYIPETFGVTWDEYRAHVRRSVETSLRIERAAAFELSRHERVQIRLLRVPDLDLAEEIHGKLERGADFATLAKTHSIDAAAANGGLYPPLPLDLPSPLFDLVRGLRDGQLSEPLLVEEEGRRSYRIVQRLATLPAVKESYAERRGAVEDELAERPISSLELEAWMRIMGDRHGIAWFGMGRAVEASGGTPAH